MLGRNCLLVLSVIVAFVVLECNVAIIAKEEVSNYDGMKNEPIATDNTITLANFMSSDNNHKQQPLERGLRTIVDSTSSLIEIAGQDSISGEGGISQVKLQNEAAIEGNASSAIPTQGPTMPPRKGVLLVRGMPDFVYIADPNVLVVGDTIYLFCSTDPSYAGPRTRFNMMREYTLLTTTSVETNVSWTNHGVILRPTTRFPNVKSFQNKMMFAPGASYKDGWFYIYFPYLGAADGPCDVGIARSMTPTDPESWELVVVAIPNTNLFDPAVMMAPDGTAYLYGNSRGPKDPPTAKKMLAAPLNSDMATLSASFTVIYGGPITEAVFAFWRTFPDPANPLTTRTLYYFMARVQSRSHDCLRYWVSSTPMPSLPRKIGGMRLTPDQYDAPPHASVAEFKGRFYLFYHSGAMNLGNKWRRSTCMDELKFTKEGLIVPVDFSCLYKPTRSGRPVRR